MTTAAKLFWLRLALNHQAAIIHPPLKPWKQGFFFISAVPEAPLSKLEQYQLFGVFRGRFTFPSSVGADVFILPVGDLDQMHLARSGHCDFDLAGDNLDLFLAGAEFQIDGEL